MKLSIGADALRRDALAKFSSRTVRIAQCAGSWEPAEAHVQLHLSMFDPSRLVKPEVRLGLCGLAIFLCARPTESAPAKGSKERAACAAGYESAQQLESASRLRQAKDTFAACMRAACTSVQAKCAANFTRLESDIPTVIPIVTDASGEARSNVQVTIDGVVLATELDGRALPVDPGLHVFSFAEGGDALGTKKVLIVQGEHDRAISIEVSSPEKHAASASTPADATPPPSTDRPEPAPAPKKEIAAPAAEGSAPEPTAGGGAAVAPLLLGSLGLAGVGAYGALTYLGKKDNEPCSPSCSAASLDRSRKLFLAADISLGVGVAALGAATWIAFASGSSKARPNEAAYAIDVTPTRSGAFASVTGSF
jgi:hypothetical protein